MVQHYLLTSSVAGGIRYINCSHRLHVSFTLLRRTFTPYMYVIKKDFHSFREIKWSKEYTIFSHKTVTRLILSLCLNYMSDLVQDKQILRISSELCCSDTLNRTTGQSYLWLF